MPKSKEENCKQLVWRADKKETPLKRNIGFDSDYISFAQKWISKFNETSRANVAEKMIYLWVTINAWASIVVPDKTRNHEDAYLIHAMSADAVFCERFKELMAKKTHSFKRVNELINLAPVFQVLWLRNNDIEAWEPESPRKEYVHNVLAKKPYKIFKNKDGSESKLYHYRPECAQIHIDKNEPIPVDWPHTLHTIYQIRCNLFHGGKNYSSERDKHFIELAYKILWDMFEPEFQQLNLMDAVKDKGLSWEKVFAESGFYFEFFNNAYDFSRENPHNLTYLNELFCHLGISDQFSSKSNVFSPNSKRFSQEKWLSAVEKLHIGAEGGPSGMEQIELKIMDTYMAGFVRWLNYIGLATTYSCDGHDREAPAISLAQSGDQNMLKNILGILNTGVRLYRRGRDSNTVTLFNARSNNRNDFDRSHLLSLAENLYKNKDDLKDLVNIMNRMHVQSGINN